MVYTLSLIFPDKEPFASAVFHTASAHYIPSSSIYSIFQEGSKQRVLSFRFTDVQLHSFTHCLHLLAGSQGGLCESGARSNASTVSCSRSRSGRRKNRWERQLPHLPLCASACFRRRAIVAVSTPFAEAAKGQSRAVNWTWNKNISSACVAT